MKVLTLGRVALLATIRGGPYVVAVNTPPCDMRGGIPAKGADHNGVRSAAPTARLIDRPFRALVDLVPLHQHRDAVRQPRGQFPGGSVSSLSSRWVRPVRCSYGCRPTVLAAGPPWSPRRGFPESKRDQMGP